MSLNNYKITSYENNIKDLPDQIAGRAAWLKEFFDARTSGEIKTAINGIVDSLLAQGGAGEIGASAPAGVLYLPEEEKTVQAVLNGLKEYINTKVAGISAGGGGGGGDMSVAVYDPEGLKLNFYDYAKQKAGEEAKTAALKYTQEHSTAEAFYGGGLVEIASLHSRVGENYKIEFAAPVAFSAMHQYDIDGEAVSVVLPTNQPPATGAWAKGAWVVLQRVGTFAYFQ